MVSVPVCQVALRIRPLSDVEMEEGAALVAHRVDEQVGFLCVNTCKQTILFVLERQIFLPSAIRFPFVQLHKNSNKTNNSNKNVSCSETGAGEHIHVCKFR